MCGDSLNTFQEFILQLTNRQLVHRWTTSLESTRTEGVVPSRLLCTQSLQRVGPTKIWCRDLIFKPYLWLFGLILWCKFDIPCQNDVLQKLCWSAALFFVCAWLVLACNGGNSAYMSKNSYKPTFFYTYIYFKYEDGKHANNIWRLPPDYGEPLQFSGKICCS